MSQDAYFTDASMLRRVLREYVVAFSGPRALLMMAAHPVAFEGFFMSTGALDDPYERLRRTAVVMDEIVWGSRRKADRMTAHVRKMHAGARGTLPADAGAFPAGTVWAADSPELLLWIVACLMDSASLAYDRYVARMTRDERDALWQDYKVVGACFGLRAQDMPDTVEDFDAYMAAMLAGDTLWVTDRARELGRRIVFNPPLPMAARPLVEVVNQITVGLLPRKLRKGFRLRWDPVRDLAVTANAEYVKRAVVPFLPDRLRYVPGARAA